MEGPISSMQIENDDGWNVEVIPGAQPRGFRLLKEVLLDHNLVSYFNRNTYIYQLASNTWSVLVSAEAQIQICSIVGSDNASVNYLAASIPYFRHLEANAQRVAYVPVSINIGTRRLRILADDNNDELHLSLCNDLLKVPQLMDERVAGFCVMPCMLYSYPTRWKTGGDERLLKYITPLFSDASCLDTLMWALGNALVDPSSVSKLLLFYGPGGTGKSTLISIIETVFKGCSSTIRSSVLTENRLDSRTQESTDKAVASSRILTAGDIDLCNHNLNLHIVKELTGHDSVSIPPIKVATSCSVIAACNDLPDPSKQKDWCSAAICRRALVFLMNVKSTLIPQRSKPGDESDILDFLMRCTSVYLKSPYPPVSTSSILYTILGNAYVRLREHIEISEHCTMQEIFDANTSIEIYLGLEVHTLGAMASLVSPLAVITEGSIQFIKDIRLIKSLDMNV